MEEQVRARGPARRRLASLGVAGLIASCTVALVPAGTAAADAGDQPFSGSVRNYGAFAGPEILNTINARANISEAIAVASSTGLSAYSGTGTGDFAVPGSIAEDPTARAYGRAAPIGAGFTGLNLNIVNAESSSTTVVDGDEEVQNFGNLDLGPVGSLSAFTGSADTNWNSTVLSEGGVLAAADSNTGTLVLLPGLPVPVPGLPLPLGEAEIGQNTGEVRLVPDDAVCAEGLAVEAYATWDFADVHLFDGFIDVSWGGDAGGENDSANMTAIANGSPGGAQILEPELGDMTINVGDLELTLQPGLAIELSEVFDDAGGLGNVLGTLVDGELTYGGTTDVIESPDGTHAHAALNGLTGNLSLLPVPIVAPNGLGSVELGVMRGEVDAVAPAGGLNCEPAATDPTGTEPTGTEPTGTEPTGTEPTGTEPTGTEPTGTEPTGTEPTGTEPTGTEPTGTEPTGTEPTGTEPTGTEPTGTEPTGTEPTGTEPTGTEPTGTEPTGTEPTGTEPTGTEPTGTEPTGTEPTGTEPTGTEPTGTEPTGTEGDESGSEDGDQSGTDDGSESGSDDGSDSGNASGADDGDADGSGGKDDGSGGDDLPDTGSSSVALIGLGSGLLLLGMAAAGAAWHRRRLT